MLKSTTPIRSDLVQSDFLSVVEMPSPKPDYKPFDPDPIRCRDSMQPADRFSNEIADCRARFHGRSEAVEPVTPPELLRERSRSRRARQEREQVIAARETAAEQRERALAVREASFA